MVGMESFAISASGPQTGALLLSYIPLKLG